MRKLVRKTKPSTKTNEEVPVNTPSRKSSRATRNKKKYVAESEDSADETPEEEVYLESSTSDDGFSEGFQIRKLETKT